MDDEGRVIVADCRNHRVQVLSRDGEPLFKFGDSGPEKLNRPFGCIYHENKFIVSDYDNNSVKFYDNTGNFLYRYREELAAFRPTFCNVLNNESQSQKAEFVSCIHSKLQQDQKKLNHIFVPYITI